MRAGYWLAVAPHAATHSHLYRTPASVVATSSAH